MRLAADAWRRFFDSFEHEAFRLETLPRDEVAGEDAELRSFLSTGRLVLPPDDPWLVRVRHFQETGRSVRRVHVLRRPLTDYLRYEFAVYDHTVRAGEDVRILDVTDDADPGLPAQDFWLFDDARVVRMDYEPGGRQLGRELLDGDPEPYVARKHQALRRAVPFLDYRTTLVG